MPGNIDHSRFIAMLIERFPEIAAQIDDCSKGLLHCEMGTMARATQEVIDRNEKGTIQAHFQFIDEVFRDAAPDVENAVFVSYLENLQFDGGNASGKARDLLPPRLKQALVELEDHFEQLAQATKRLRK